MRSPVTPAPRSATPSRRPPVRERSPRERAARGYPCCPEVLLGAVPFWRRAMRILGVGPPIPPPTPLFVSRWAARADGRRAARTGTQRDVTFSTAPGHRSARRTPGAAAGHGALQVCRRFSRRQTFFFAPDGEHEGASPARRGRPERLQPDRRAPGVGSWPYLTGAHSAARAGFVARPASPFPSTCRLSEWPLHARGSTSLLEPPWWP
jgi:hypothetical protein